MVEVSRVTRLDKCPPPPNPSNPKGMPTDLDHLNAALFLYLFQDDLAQTLLRILQVTKQAKEFLADIIIAEVNSLGRFPGIRRHF